MWGSGEEEHEDRVRWGSLLCLSAWGDRLPVRSWDLLLDVAFLELEETVRKWVQQDGRAGHAALGFLDKDSPLSFHHSLFPWKVWLQIPTLAGRHQAQGQRQTALTWILGGMLGILAGRLGWKRILCLDAAVALRGRSVGSVDFL